ncbi:MAG: hypothetical protein DRR08_03555 [Candidatus Parabeggiatoa sp. nov. 2]|nr:MAG: hypothetical protein B6247_14080 [Beggiatoa sp. 4572_84]RKZ63419.1 MAG: hypothetical protein DRR08_03555 [Gammaproteobacteria bacterium]
MPETLLRLKAPCTKIADIQKDSLKLRGENADLKKALDDACKYIDRLKRVQVKTPKALSEKR